MTNMPTWLLWTVDICSYYGRERKSTTRERRLSGKAHSLLPCVAQFTSGLPGSDCLMTLMLCFDNRWCCDHFSIEEFEALAAIADQW